MVRISKGHQPWEVDQGFGVERLYLYTGRLASGPGKGCLGFLSGTTAPITLFQKVEEKKNHAIKVRLLLIIIADQLKLD